MITTLFMLASVDGKISTGSTKERDFDKDLVHIRDVSEGLRQYYELEEQTDLYSLNTGKVLAKVGWNDVKESIDNIPVSFVIIDNEPHLTKLGIENLLKRCKKILLVTTNTSHPAFKITDENLETKHYDIIDFENLFKDLAEQGVERMTIQSGGDMNATLLRAGLIDEVSIIFAPALIGGKDTPSLIGGESIQAAEELKNVKALKLVEVQKLNNSYLHLRYAVAKNYTKRILVYRHQH